MKKNGTGENDLQLPQRVISASIGSISTTE